LKKIELPFKLIFSFCIIFALSLIAAFRGSTFDTENYIDIFNNIDWQLGPVSIWNEYHIEYGFIIYNGLIKFLSQGDIKAYFFISSFIPLYLFYKSADILQVNPVESLIILSGSYFPLLYLIQMRQGLAIALSIYAVCSYYKKRSIAPFFTIGLIAFTIHISSSIFLICGFLYPLYERRWRGISGYLKILFLSLILSSLVIYLFRNSGFEKFNYYVENYDEAGDLLSITNIKYYVLFAISLLVYKSRPSNNLRFLLYFITLNVGFRVGLYEIFVLSGRLTSIFSVMEIFVLPLIFKNLKINFWCGLIIIILYSIISLYYLLFIKYTHIIELY